MLKGEIFLVGGGGSPRFRKSYLWREFEKIGAERPWGEVGRIVVDQRANRPAPLGIGRAATLTGPAATAQIGAKGFVYAKAPAAGLY